MLFVDLDIVSGINTPDGHLPTGERTVELMTSQNTKILTHTKVNFSRKYLHQETSLPLTSLLFLKSKTI